MRGYGLFFPVPLTKRTIDEISKCMMIATHPRSGTHLTIDLLRKQFRDFQSWLW
jgi:hypothetical protein